MLNLNSLQMGLSGAYCLFVVRHEREIAISKPINEEHLAFNNPKRFGGLLLGMPGIQLSVHPVFKVHQFIRLGYLNLDRRA